MTAGGTGPGDGTSAAAPPSAPPAAPPSPAAPPASRAAAPEPLPEFAARRRPRPVVSPTRSDPFARWASGLIGGPAGSRIAFPAHAFWNATRVLVLVAVVLVAFSVAQKNDCRTRGWFNPDQFVHTCYSNLPIEYAGAGSTAAGLLGYGATEGSGHPAVASAVLAAVAALTNAVAPAFGDDTVRNRVFFDLSALVVALSAAAMALGLTRLTRRRPWDATLAVASPVLVLAGMVSIDLLGVALGVLAVWAWSRERPALAGAVLGLAVAARFHVLLIAVALVLLSLRTPRWQQVSATLLTALGTWVAVHVPWLLTAPDAIRSPVEAWLDSTPSYGSLLFLPSLLAAGGVPGVRGLTAGEATAVTVMGMAVVVVLTAVWVLSAARAPRLPAVVLVLVVGTLLVAKSVPVQASLWLLPWAALAVPRWRPHVWWWVAEGLYFVAVWQYLVSLTDPSRALPGGYYAVLLVGRLGAMVWLVSHAWSWAWHPDADPGRDPGVDGVRGRDDDPAAGPFARVPAAPAVGPVVAAPGPPAGPVPVGAAQSGPAPSGPISGAPPG